MSDKLVEIIVEKGLLALILAVAGYWLSKNLEIDKQNYILSNKIFESNREKQISTIETQLSEFYYPIYFRLQKDNTLWKLSPQLSNDKNALPIDANEIIERDYVLTNHQEILSIIQNKIHLIQIDEKLQESINLYVKHVTVYTVIRRIVPLKKFNPAHFHAPYPHDFFRQIEARINTLQIQHNKLLENKRSV